MFPYLFPLIFHFRISTNCFQNSSNSLEILFFIYIFEKVELLTRESEHTVFIISTEQELQLRSENRSGHVGQNSELVFPSNNGLSQNKPCCRSVPYVPAMSRNQDLICPVCPKWAICVLAEQFCLVSGSDSKDRGHVGKTVGSRSEKLQVRLSKHQEEVGLTFQLGL